MKKHIWTKRTEGCSTNIRERPKIDYKDMVKYTCYTLTLEQKNAKEALTSEHRIILILEEL
jgi:hypothetical protein